MEFTDSNIQLRNGLEQINGILQMRTDCNLEYVNQSVFKNVENLVEVQVSDFENNEQMLVGFENQSDSENQEMDNLVKVQAFGVENEEEDLEDEAENDEVELEDEIEIEIEMDTDFVVRDKNPMEGLDLDYIPVDEHSGSESSTMSEMDDEHSGSDEELFVGMDE